MKNKIFFLVCFVFGLAISCLAQERITAFHVQLDIDTLNNMRVVEEISVISAGYEIKRGIFRKIPFTRKDKYGFAVENKIKVASVTQDGQTAEYKTSEKKGLLEIRIGNANTFLDDGDHHYVITYTIQNQVGFFEGYDEIYWNVTGTDWNFYIDTATCRVNLPAAAKFIQSSCYTGAYGSKEQACKDSLYEGAAYFTAYALQPGEGLTIAAGFTKGVVQPPPPPTFLEQYGVLGLAIAFMLAIILYMANAWRKHGIDPPKPTVIPQFAVPGNLSPAQIAVYNKKNVATEFLTVSLISLAVKGFIKITEGKTTTLFIFKDTEYTLTKEKDTGISDLPKEEQALMNSLFPGSKISIKADGKYEKRFATANSKFLQSFSDEKNKINLGHNRKFLWIPFLLIIAFWVVVAFYNAASVFTSAVAIGALILVPLLLIIPILIFSAMFKINFRFALVYKTLVIFITALFIGFLLLDVVPLPFTLKVVLLFSFLALVLFLSYAYLIKKPSEDSLALEAEIEGFKMYMKAAEEKQLQMFNAPKHTPELFEQLLPYAMALGVDKIWGDKFSAVLQAAMQDNSYSPAWYAGSNFHTNNFHSIGNDISSTISNSSVAPESSGGGYSSGSGGGGSSGGGGGGGGGGGW